MESWNLYRSQQSRPIEIRPKVTMEEDKKPVLFTVILQPQPSTSTATVAPANRRRDPTIAEKRRHEHAKRMREKRRTRTDEEKRVHRIQNAERMRKFRANQRQARIRASIARGEDPDRAEMQLREKRAEYMRRFRETKREKTAARRRESTDRWNQIPGVDLKKQKRAELLRSSMDDQAVAVARRKRRAALIRKHLKNRTPEEVAKLRTVRRRTRKEIEGGEPDEAIVDRSFEKTPCPVCQRVFFTSSIPSHMATHLPNAARQFHCKICNRGFTAEYIYREHYKRMHSYDPPMTLSTFSCHICTAAVETRVKFLSHLRGHMEAGEVEIGDTEELLFFTCDAQGCFLCFNDKTQFQHHVVTEHGGCVCDTCGKCLAVPKNFDDHVTKAHGDGDNSVACDFCWQFVDAEEAEQHRQKHIMRFCDGSTAGAVCHECGKTYASNKSLEEHRQRSHSAISTSCGICGEHLHSINRLRTHLLNVHTYDHPLVCHLCSKEFNFLYLLQSHIRRIHEGRNRSTNYHNCRYCTKTFAFHVHRNQHEVLAHAQTLLLYKPYYCVACFRAFQYENQHREHMRKHEKYRCTICDIYCLARVNFDYHMATHEKGSRARRHYDNSRRYEMQKLKLEARLSEVGTLFDRPVTAEGQEVLDLVMRASRKELVYMGRASERGETVEGVGGPLEVPTAVARLFTETKQLAFVCDQCPAQFDYPASLLLHLKRHDACKSGNYSDDVDLRLTVGEHAELDDDAVRQLEMKYGNPNAPTQKCDKCDEIFYTKRRWNDHYLSNSCHLPKNSSETPEPNPGPSAAGAQIPNAPQTAEQREKTTTMRLRDKRNQVRKNSSLIRTSLPVEESTSHDKSVDPYECYIDDNFEEPSEDPLAGTLPDDPSARLDSEMFVYLDPAAFKSRASSRNSSELVECESLVEPKEEPLSDYELFQDDEEFPRSLPAVLSRLRALQTLLPWRLQEQVDALPTLIALETPLVDIYPGVPVRCPSPEGYRSYGQESLDQYGDSAHFDSSFFGGSTPPPKAPPKKRRAQKSKRTDPNPKKRRGSGGMSGMLKVELTEGEETVNTKTVEGKRSRRKSATVSRVSAEPERNDSSEGEEPEEEPPALDDDPEFVVSEVEKSKTKSVPNETKRAKRKKKAKPGHVVRVRGDVHKEPIHCPSCTKTFEFFKSLKRHFSDVHPEQDASCLDAAIPKPNIFNCHVCSKEIESKKRFDRHLRTHLAALAVEPVVYTFACDTAGCRRHFIQRDIFLQHLETHKPPGASLVTCPDCPKTFSVTAIFEEHTARVHEGKELSCVYCLKSFNDAQFLEKHVEAVHKIDLSLPLLGDFMCDVCGTSVKDKRTLERHKFLHLDDFSSLVDPVDGMISLAQLPRRKVFGAKVANNVKKPCPICGRMLGVRKALRTHLLMEHTYEHGLTCFICDAKYSRYGVLTNHLETHRRNGVLPPNVLLPVPATAGLVPKKRDKKLCIYCGEGFSDTLREFKHYFKFHRAEYLREKPFHCQHCFKAVATAAELQAHQVKSHDHLKCTECGKQFLRTDLFRAHQLAHSGERPLLCELCPKTFDIIDNLRRHVERIHQKKRMVPAGRRGRKTEDESGSESEEDELLGAAETWMETQHTHGPL